MAAGFTSDIIDFYWLNSVPAQGRRPHTYVALEAIIPNGEEKTESGGVQAVDVSC